MIIHNVSAAAQPVAYAGGLVSSSRPGFASALQATLAGLQATQAGTAALLQGAGHPHQSSGALTNGTHNRANELLPPG